MDTNKLIPLLAEMAVFVTVVEEGSFANAAVKLGVAPSSSAAHCGALRQR